MYNDNNLYMIYNFIIYDNNLYNINSVKELSIDIYIYIYIYNIYNIYIIYNNLIYIICKYEYIYIYIHIYLNKRQLSMCYYMLKKNTSFI